MQKTLLVVDDDPDLRSLLRDYLTEQGYRVLEAADGEGLWAHLAQTQVDLIILDLMLPGDDGLTLCRNIRARQQTPILMLTARGDEMDRIIGLEMGADDYLPKPFHPRELLARIRSIFRRAEQSGSQPVRHLRFGNWTLDLGAHHLIGADEVVVPLSTGEFRLLKALVEHANTVLSRDQLMDALAGREADPLDRTIDVMISRLRRRLGDDAREPTLIKTIRNEGYILTVGQPR
ncbi:DNA-binding response regulator [Halothiobacillus diazotrophicus]|uniref:DNA-binding response regulator n=1 Tax=Halothiobacillus diazotrophicus TaxID=1860122 RepID=A0A191ZJP9_9GAMM|nr:response regulator [Halothiobacillus diazotrophicus]ANJ68131.1 DNA-binding response regulator [Halothiobacillus diazotrophicus]